MPFSEIPSKIIERTESLTECKLQVSTELTKLYYTLNKKETCHDDTSIIKIYHKFYNHLRDVVPPALEGKGKKKIYIYIFLYLITFAIIGFCYFYLKIHSLF
jgi:hypothetical protein